MEGPPLRAESPSSAGVVATAALSSTSPGSVRRCWVVIQRDVRSGGSEWPATPTLALLLPVSIAPAFIDQTAPAGWRPLHVGCPLSPSRAVPHLPPRRPRRQCQHSAQTHHQRSVCCIAHRWQRQTVPLLLHCPGNAPRPLQMRALAGWILRRHTPSPGSCLQPVCTCAPFWKHAQSSKVSHFPRQHWLRRSVVNVTRSLSHTPQHSFIQ